MATYYWLGKQASTGTGNVNIPLNWTTIGPSGSSGAIPPSGTSIPGNGDFIVFTKFVGGTSTYPLYSPGGTLGTGVSGTTAFISGIDIIPSCPVAIGICGQGGTDEPFRVNCLSYCNFYTNSTEGSPTSLTGADYIHFTSNKIGATPAVYDPKVTIVSFTSSAYSPRKIRLSGTVGNLQLSSPSFNYGNAEIYLDSITLSGGGLYQNQRALQVEALSQDKIYISEKAKINSIYLAGNSKTYISPGFGSTGALTISGSLFTSPTRIPTLDFVVGACGASYGIPLITQINRINTLGVGQCTFTNIYHGLGISYLDQRGGVMNFVVPPGSTGLMCSVYEGRFSVPDGSILKSEYPTVTLGEGPLGGGGSFIIVNTAGVGFGAVPKIQMKGSYDVEINPYTETN